MAITRFVPDYEEFYVIHPLKDVREEKRSGAGLGRMRMTKAVRISLGVLRIYLIAMSLMLGYHVLHLAGLLQ